MDMDTLNFTLHQQAKRVGISDIARQLGWPEQRLINALNPQSATHEVKLSEFIAVLHRIDADPVLEVLCAMFSRRLATRCQGRMPSLMAAVLHAFNEQSDIGRAVERAWNDDESPGRITPQERADILRECSEARTAITLIENTVSDPDGVVVHVDIPGRRA